MRRVIALARPAWVVGENVAGLIPLALDDVLADLEADGYTSRALVIPACAVDAKHRRDRVWIIARDSDINRKSARAIDGEEVAQLLGTTADASSLQWRSIQRDESDGALPRDGDVAHANGTRLALRQGERSDDGAQRATALGACRWEPEPAVGRVANGVPRRVDRLRCLGNAVVPQVVEEIGRAIMLSV
jgi:DNA (cytosine-5)-methyltransferase 1